MNGPKATLEDDLFRRLLQDKLDALGDHEVRRGAMLLADSLVEARIAVKWLTLQLKEIRQQIQEEQKDPPPPE
ncbi:MAG: hypothetical protein ACPGSE_00050 [Synechococcus sp.]